MSLAKAILAARLEMQPIFTANTVDTGKYRFKYADLDSILEVVVPILGRHGVMLMQDSGSVEADPTLVFVMTRLVGAEDGETISSSALYYRTTGDVREVGKNITILSRYQLCKFLGLATTEDTPENNGQVQPAAQRNQPVTATPPADTWAAQAPLRKAAMFSMAPDIGFHISAETAALMDQMRQADDSSPEPMPVVATAGKKASMYGYLCGLIDKACEDKWHGEVLSFLLGRVVSKETPPGYDCRLLIDNFAKYQDNIIEIADVIETGPAK